MAEFVYDIRPELANICQVQLFVGQGRTRSTTAKLQQISRVHVRVARPQPNIDRQSAVVERLQIEWGVRRDASELE